MIDSKNELEQWGPIDAKILYHSSFLLPMSGKFRKLYGIDWSHIFGILDHHRLTYRWNKKRLELHGVEIIKKWLLPKVQRNKSWKIYQKSVDQLHLLDKKIKQLNSENSLESHLPDLISDLYDKFIDFWNIALVPETANFGAVSFLSKKLETLVPAEQMNEVLEALLALDRRSFHQESDLQLFKLALRKGNFKNFADKWSWIENSYFEVKILTDKDFSRRVKGLSTKVLQEKIQATERYTKNVTQRKQQIAKKYHLPKQILEYARLLSFSIWWQDDRKAEIWKTLESIQPLIRITSTKFGIPIDDLMFYTLEEWVELVTYGRRLSQVEVTNRKQLCIIIMQNQNYKIITGPKALKFSNKYQNDTKSNDNMLSGTTVSRGPIVRGRVRVILSARDHKAMKKGEILVTAMTEPDFIVVMRKAKAIITDVGGLMSHAAVVSRELGIPCIVGTKIATQVLKDGDLVEVDANKGIVRKI